MVPIELPPPLFAGGAHSAPPRTQSDAVNFRFFSVDP